MTYNHRSRRVAVAAVLTAAAGLSLWSAPQGFAASPNGANAEVVAFDPQPDPPGRLLKVESVDKDARGYGAPDTFEGGIIIHYNQPVEPDASAGRR